MLTSSDIQLIIKGGEGYHTEFKVSVPSKVKELTEEICAFANAAGGTLLIGVNDNNEIKGITIDNAKRSAIQNSIREISPILDCHLSFIEIDEKTIGVIEVPSGVNKPYVLSGSIYVRNGPNTQKLTTAEEMRDFFQQADKIHFDEITSKEFDLANDVDEDMLNKFKRAAKLDLATPDSQIYASLKMLSVNGRFKNGSVLFFGKQPQTYIEKATVRCVAFRGTDKRYITDDKFYGGPLYFQYLNAMEWLRGKLDVGYDIEGQGAGPRKEIWEIPENAFKESLINSLSHRDYYDKGATITVEFFDDRVEITNPGGLVKSIKKSDFGKKSHSRNPLIFSLFTRMNMVEQIGSGISRMNKLMTEVGLPSPEFRTSGMFTVVFQRPNKNKKISSGMVSEEMSEENILALIKNNPEITIPEIAQRLNKTPRTIERQMQNLKKMGVLIRIGSRKAGYWEILEK